MGKFILGIIVGLILVGAGSYIYVHFGFMNMQADQAVGTVEGIYMRGAMDRYVGRHAPKLTNPVEPTEANLVDGVRLYKMNCAVWHGGPDKPVSELGLGFNPRAPQFVKDAPDMADNENYWIIRHGVKMTGMPAWEKVMSDNDMWKVTTFLGKMEDLDRLPPAVQQAWKGGGQAELGAQQNPTAPPSEQQTPPPATPKHKH